MFLLEKNRHLKSVINSPTVRNREEVWEEEVWRIKNKANRERKY